MQFLGIFLQTHGWNGLKFGMLMYPHHLQDWLDFVTTCSFSLFCCISTWRNRSNFWFQAILSITDRRNSLQFGMQMYPDYLQDWFDFGGILTWNVSNLGFPGIFLRTHVGNALKFGMLMYPDHIHDCLDLVMVSWISWLLFHGFMSVWLAFCG